MFSSRDIALVASMSAVYAGYSFLSSNTIGYITHGVDTFLIRSILFVVLSFLTTKAGIASLMGIISGAIIEFTTPTPVHFYIFPSVVAYGITYDAFMSKRPLRLYPKTSAVLIATALSSAAMAGVALSVLTYSGFFLPEILPMIWFFGVLRDVLLGLVGALIGIKISRTILHIR